MSSHITSNQKTVDEIVDFILEHEGPDLDRRARPEKKQVRYVDLDEALNMIHKEGLLPDLRTYHFNHVLGIWITDKSNSNPLGRELTGQLIESLKQRYGSLIEVVKNIKQDDFYKEQFEFKNKNGVIRYSLWSMLTCVYAASPSAAVVDWIKNNPDEEIRKEYAGIRPW
ncbi:hypothetical protein HYU07_07400, partial [Candidatus Woesearchaeota archaeon]|nr:hypothetical protein [Candidatus Woesearchaeota archaeon]